jgi:hypothetical protein
MEDADSIYLVQKDQYQAFMYILITPPVLSKTEKCLD